MVRGAVVNQAPTDGTLPPGHLIFASKCLAFIALQLSPAATIHYKNYKPPLIGSFFPTVMAYHNMHAVW